ncbi:MAG: hypothetical protein HY279_10175 [Nitrospinae bacterium]|nr:hypothetical protein [Nitrospinota bacterium]
MDVILEERVDKVEIALERFIDEMRAFRHKIDQYIVESEKDRRTFQREMATFRENSYKEMRAFQREMATFRENSDKEMRAFQREMATFRENSDKEMRAFQGEMATFKENSDKENKRMNKRWGEISNKLGTLVEDIVAPSIPRIVKERFNIKVVDLSVRRKRELNGLSAKEWDAIAVSSEMVFLNYTRSTLRSQDIDEFLRDIKIFRDYFPEYKEKGVIGVLASLYINEGVIRYAEKNGLLVLGIGDELMEILNSKDFEPVSF